MCWKSDDGAFPTSTLKKGSFWGVPGDSLGWEDLCESSVLLQEQDSSPCTGRAASACRGCDRVSAVLQSVGHPTALWNSLNQVWPLTQLLLISQGLPQAVLLRQVLPSFAPPSFWLAKDSKVRACRGDFWPAGCSAALAGAAAPTAAQPCPSQLSRVGKVTSCRQMSALNGFFYLLWGSDWLFAVVTARFVFWKLFVKKIGGIRNKKKITVPKIIGWLPQDNWVIRLKTCFPFCLGLQDIWRWGVDWRSVQALLDRIFLLIEQIAPL